MKARSLETFRLSVRQQLQEFSSRNLFTKGSEEEQLEVVRHFYNAHQESLNCLLEDTQAEHPVTNTIISYSPDRSAGE